MQGAAQNASIAFRNAGTICAIVLALLGGPGVCAAAPQTGSESADACGQVTLSHRAVDYRLRESTPQLLWEFGDNTRYHYEPAVESMRAGEYSRRVIADLDFLVVRWPNHIPALRAMIEYELAGGKPHEFARASCYLAQARTFARDDVNVVLLDGFYRWKKHDLEGALAAFNDALALDPKSADAHYNLGLLYIETKQFDKAREHAAAAYAAGHPLPGLRRKLAQAGYALSR